MVRQVLRRRRRADAGMVAQLAVHRGQEIHALEPPVTEQLRVERCDDDAGSFRPSRCGRRGDFGQQDRKSTRLNSSHLVISYAVFCLKKKKKKQTHDTKSEVAKPQST